MTEKQRELDNCFCVFALESSRAHKTQLGIASIRLEFAEAFTWSVGSVECVGGGGV